MQLGRVVTNAQALERGIPARPRAPLSRAQPCRVGAAALRSCSRRQHRLHAQQEDDTRCSQAERDPEAELVTEAPSTSDYTGPAALQQEQAQSQSRREYHWSPGVLLAAAPLLGFAGSQGGFEFPGGTIASVLVLASIITIHEAGHFFAARLQGVHIQEFSVGVGPQLFKYKGEKVTYSLRALPLAGYVAFPDNDPKSKIPKDDPDLLKNRPIWDRLLVLSAGVIANTVFAWCILFAQANTVGMVDAVSQPGVILGGMEKATPQAKALLRKGDVVVAVDGQTLRGRKGDVNSLVTAITRHPEHDITLDVARGSQVSQYMLQPELDGKGDGRLGLHLASNVRFVHTKAQGIPDAVVRTNGALQRCFGQGIPDAVVRTNGVLRRCFGQVIGGFKSLFSNFAGASSTLSGPVGVVAAGADAVKQDPAGLFQYAALINVNLAVVNTLPLPALDGGYLVLLVIEALRGKKLSKIVEQNIIASGLLLFASLSIFLIARDTFNLTGL